MGLEIVAVTDEGLGHSAHLVAVDDDVLVIDPLRVVRRYLDPTHEYLDGHIPAAVNVEFGAIESAPLVSPDPITLMCGHGERAASAASLLERRGIDASIAVGGPDDWSAATGHPLEDAS